MLLQIMTPVQTDPTIFTDNAHEIFNRKEKMKVQNIDAQKLYNPKIVGWLFRSNWVMTTSSELRLAIEAETQKKLPGMAMWVSVFRQSPLQEPMPMTKYNTHMHVHVSCTCHTRAMLLI